MNFSACRCKRLIYESGKFRWEKQGLLPESILKVSLDHFAPNLYISNKNQVLEPSYTAFIKHLQAHSKLVGEKITEKEILSNPNQEKT